jgi:hypothetical protein
MLDGEFHHRVPQPKVVAYVRAQFELRQPEE